ncbi:hypothetical protein D3C72_2390730 [compost metagenome]
MAGNQAATMRLLAGKDGASEAPTMKRRPKSVATAASPVRKPTEPVNSVKSDQKKMLNA